MLFMMKVTQLFRVYCFSTGISITAIIHFFGKDGRGLGLVNFVVFTSFLAVFIVNKDVINACSCVY